MIDVTLTNLTLIKLMPANLAFLAPFQWSALAQTSAIQLVDCLVEGTSIAILAALVLAVCRRQNSGTRFAVWFSALMAIAALPLFGVSVWSHIGSAPARPWNHAAFILPGSWAIYLFGAWAVIAMGLLTRIGWGLWSLRVLRASCVAVDLSASDPSLFDPSAFDLRLQATLERGRSRRPVALCTSTLANVPTAIGLLKPAIVLPPWVLHELSGDELHQIVLHELAHLHRWDDWTNLAQKIVKALFFFHPAIWWIEKRVSLEREMACDDAVLAQIESPRTYAECLAHLAERTLMQRSIAFAQAALGRIRQTSLRVAQILDVNRPANANRAWKPAAVAAFAVVCVLSLSRAPQLVAFRDSPNDAPAIFTMATADQNSGSSRASIGNSAANVAATNAEFRTQPLQVVPASLNVNSGSVLSNLNQSRSVNTKQSRAMRPNMIRLANADTTDISRANLCQTNLRQSSLRQSNLGQASVRQVSLRRTDVLWTDDNLVPVTFTETIFVIIEDGTNVQTDQPVYQIQWWRVMVFHPALNSSNDKIPAKQT
jgi:hypothetical protein